VDKLLENNEILKDLVSEKDEEINILTENSKQCKDKKLSTFSLNPEFGKDKEFIDKQVQVDNKDEANEMKFIISKCQEIIQKYQDFFDDLQSSYSLPEG
jgi:hypothetical protein